MFYVYEHLRADSGRVFYVGKGRGVRATVTSNRNTFWNRVRAKAGGFSIRYVAYSEDEELIHLAEMERISQLRKLGVRLTNMTDGGEGMSGYVWTPEAARARANWARGKKRPDISALLKGIPKTAEHRAALSASRKGMRLTEETKRKISIVGKGRPSPMLGKSHPEDVKAKISRSMAASLKINPRAPHSPESIKKIIAANLGRKDSEETRKKKSVARSGKKNPRFGKTVSDDQKKRQVEKLKSYMAANMKNCCHCGKDFDPCNFSRWHGEKCKKRG